MKANLDEYVVSKEKIIKRNGTFENSINTFIHIHIQVPKDFFE